MSGEPFLAAVTGIGLATPAGVGVAANWRTLTAGARTAAEPDPDLAGIGPGVSARVPGFDPDPVLTRRKARRLDRYTQLALVAAAEAVADSGLDPATWEGARVGVVLGSALGGVASWEAQHRKLLDEGARWISPMLIPMLAVNMVAGYVGIEFGAKGPNLVTATACASGATAIGVARSLLRSGECDVVLTGGTEAPLVPSIVASFAQMGALCGADADPASSSRPFDGTRDGFVPAEGAAVLVLERLADAQARGAHGYAAVRGYGASADAYHYTAPDPEGDGAERAVRAALLDAGVSPNEVDHVNAHGTSTPLNDLTEARMIRRVFRPDVSVTSAKGVTGHSLGAAGAIEAAYTALTIERSLVPPTANLSSQDPDVDLDVVVKAARPSRVELAVSNSFGFGGQNAALVLTVL